MAFNELLWSVLEKISEETTRSTLTLEDDVPISSKVFIDDFKSIISDYRTLMDFIDESTCCSDIAVVTNKTHGLYVEAFCSGLSTVLSDFNQCIVEIDLSLCDGDYSMLLVSDKLHFYANIFPSLVFAVKQIQDEKYRGCRILDLCEDLIITYSHLHEIVFRKILHHCLKQFYKQTKLWVMQALLHDPYHEFFISYAENSMSVEPSICSVVTSATRASHVGNNQDYPVFQVYAENLPSIIPVSVAIKIRFIGEALTICQYAEAESKNNDRILTVCGVSEQNISKQFSEIEKNEYFCLKNFSCLIDNLWISVNKYIRQICEEIGNVKEQLIMLWDIYLLGRGELFQEFLLKGGPLLNTDATMVDSRNLNKAFKDAIYYVYLTEYSDLSDQFIFRLPNRKALRPGFTALQVMRLKYKVKWPLHNLFSREVMHSYNRLFVFLLKLKKAQNDVTSTWKSINSIEDHMLRMELIELRLHLLAIIGNLQTYCFTHVISSEMTNLLESVKTTVMFSDLQNSVHCFLMNISNRIFFPDANLTRFSTFDKSPESLETVFMMIFSLCKSFSELHGKDDKRKISELKPFKKKLQGILKTLFSILNKIDETFCYDGSSSSSHLYNLMMCLDYNRFFQNKFNLHSFE